MPTVQLYALDPIQEAPFESPARFKVLRVGRRGGKSRLNLHAGITGHGPLMPDGSRLHKGLAQGVDVAWIARDYKNADAIWAEEVRPRFANVPNVHLSEQDHALHLGTATLWIRSEENIDSVRGIGKLLGGVIFDECAHYDLGYAFRSVVRPAMMDRKAWGIFSSTTNHGHDGNADQITPSFFNRICADIMGGVRAAPDWEHWHWDARDNPRIDPNEFRDFLAEYDDKAATERDQEVYALLLQAGAGMAFPEWQQRIHVRALEVDPEWSCAGGLDWGHGTPGWFGLVYVGPQDKLLLRHELYYDHLLPSALGKQMAQLCLGSPRLPEYIACDSACWNVTDGSATIAEKITQGFEAEFAEWNHTHSTAHDAPPLIQAPKGPKAIETQKALLHEVLAWEEAKDGESVVLVKPPQLTVHPDCVHFCRTVPKLPVDRKHPEKFDTTAEDHPTQGFAYLLATRAPDYQAPAVPRAVREQLARLDPASRAEAVHLDAEERRAIREEKALRARVKARYRQDRATWG